MENLPIISNIIFVSLVGYWNTKSIIETEVDISSVPHNEVTMYL